MIPTTISELFDTHRTRLRLKSKRKQEEVSLKNAVDNHVVEDSGLNLGVRLPTDRFAGCTNLRTLKCLLQKIDERGWERSAHQIQFHDAFIRSTSRVMYRQDWSTSRPEIMKLNKWTKCSSEILISTPRRFGCGYRVHVIR
jgi:serine/threonine protein kinase HipA of HipAB toxin-antitoxin module